MFFANGPKKNRWVVYKIVETLFLLWLIVPKYSGAVILHDYIDAGFSLVDSLVLSNLPSQHIFFTPFHTFQNRVRELYSPAEVKEPTKAPEEAAPKAMAAPGSK